jgi:hypothetical protein
LADRISPLWPIEHDRRDTRIHRMLFEADVVSEARDVRHGFSPVQTACKKACAADFDVRQTAMLQK